MSAVVTPEDSLNAHLMAVDYFSESNDPPSKESLAKFLAKVVAAVRESAEAKGRSKAFIDLLAAMRIVARNASDWSWVERIEAFTEADAITRQGGAL